MAESPAQAVGDPHIKRTDGVKFDFKGRPNATYNLLTHQGFSIVAAISGSGNAWHWIAMTSETKTKVLFDEKDVKRTESGEWRVDVHRLNLAGSGEPHCNIHILEQPNDLTGATGLMIDGTAEAGDEYMVKPPPSPPSKT